MNLSSDLKDRSNGIQKLQTAKKPRSIRRFSNWLATNWNISQELSTKSNTQTITIFADLDNLSTSPNEENTAIRAARAENYIPDQSNLINENHFPSVIENHHSDPSPLEEEFTKIATIVRLPELTLINQDQQNAESDGLTSPKFSTRLECRHLNLPKLLQEFSHDANLAPPVRFDKKLPEPPFHVMCRKKKRRLVYLVCSASMLSPLSASLYLPSLVQVSIVCTVGCELLPRLTIYS